MNIVPILVGPTAVGKTFVSLKIADFLPVEIISADSRQMYKYMDIGTAKPASADLQKIRHHFINTLLPDAYFSAGMFARQARQCIDEIFERKNIPLVVGGSGFYIQALMDGLSESDAVDESIRKQLKEEWENGGSEKLYLELVKIDPMLARNLKPRDRQRILRGLEVYYTSGEKLSDQQQKKPKQAPFRPVLAGINAERSFLYQRINQRVEHMLQAGLVDEVKLLGEKGFEKELNALNTVGYKEVFDYLAGRMSYDEMLEEIKKNSRRYAKRQLTWFRRDKRIKWFQIEEYKDGEDLAMNILHFFKKALVL